MYSLFLLTVFSVLMLTASGGLSSTNKVTANGVVADRLDEAILAENFVVYRAAVIKYLDTASVTKSGSISDSNLSFPPGYKNLGGWLLFLSIDFKKAYIYSQSVSGSVLVAQPNNPWFSSGQIGYKDNDNWVTSNSFDALVLPRYIPNGNLVAVIERKL